MRMSQSLSRKDVPLCFSFIISIALILLRIFIGLPRKIRVIKLIRAFWFWAGSGDIPEIFSRRRVCELIEQSHIIKCFHLPPSLSFDRHVQKIPLKWSISTYSFKSEAILRLGSAHPVNETLIRRGVTQIPAHTWKTSDYPRTTVQASGLGLCPSLIGR